MDGGRGWGDNETTGRMGGSVEREGSTAGRKNKKGGKERGNPMNLEGRGEFLARAPYTRRSNRDKADEGAIRETGKENTA